MESEVASVRRAFEQMRDRSEGELHVAGDSRRSETASRDQAPQTNAGHGAAAGGGGGGGQGVPASAAPPQGGAAGAGAPVGTLRGHAGPAGKEAYWVEAMHALRTDVAARCQLIGDLVATHARARPSAPGIPRRRHPARASAPAPAAAAEARFAGRGCEGDALRLAVAQGRPQGMGAGATVLQPAVEGGDGGTPPWAVAPKRDSAASSPPTRAGASAVAERSTDAELRRQRLRAEARFPGAAHASLSTSTSLSPSAPPAQTRSGRDTLARPARTADAAAGPPSVTATESRSDAGSMASVADQVFGGGGGGYSSDSSTTSRQHLLHQQQHQQQQQQQQQRRQGNGARAHSQGAHASQVFDTEQSTPTAVGDASGVDDDDSSAYRILSEALGAARRGRAGDDPDP